MQALNMTNTLTISFPRSLHDWQIEGISSKLPDSQFLFTKPGTPLLRFSWLPREKWPEIKEDLQRCRYEVYERMCPPHIPLLPPEPEDQVSIFRTTVSRENVMPYLEANKFVFLNKAPNEWRLLRLYNGFVYIGGASFPNSWFMVLRHEDFVHNFLHVPGFNATNQLDGIYQRMVKYPDLFTPIWDVVELRRDIAPYDLCALMNWRWTAHISA